MSNPVNEKMREFADPNLAMMYACICYIRDWQAETGGTLDELLEGIDRMAAKRKMKKEET